MKVMYKNKLARLTFFLSVTVLTFAQVGDARAEEELSCCSYDLWIRSVVDRVKFSSSPLLKPSDRDEYETFRQARLELAARSSVESPLRWVFRGYVRTSQELALMTSESPAFIKVREASVDIPVWDADLTVGRIVVGSGTLKIRNLVDFLDEISVHTERRSGFLPERLENRIGTVGMQFGYSGSLGTLQIMWAPSIGLTDSNYERFTLVRAAPSLGDNSASAELSAFQSDNRLVYGFQGSVSPAKAFQVYGELSHDRRWPLLTANGNSVSLQKEKATHIGLGVEYQPQTSWSIALETIYNTKPISSNAVSDTLAYLASSPAAAARATAFSLQNLSFGFLQRLYYGTLIQRDWRDQKVSLTASYFRAQDDGSAISTLQAKWDITKQVQLSAFAKYVSVPSGSELEFAAEKKRFGIAANIFLK